MKYWSLILALITAPAIAAPNAETMANYRAIAALDARVATVGYRLATANAPFCSHKLGYNPGWVIHDIAQYPDSVSALNAFAFAQPVEVAFVVKGGEADRQGFKANDGLVRIANRDLKSFAQNKQPSAQRIVTVRAFLDEQWGPNYVVPFKVDRGTERRELLVQLNPVCASYFWVDANRKIDAGADGTQVRISSALVEYTLDDNELAAIAAHELAHNLLGHPIGLATTRKSKSISATELEADRLSVWLLTNARYDPRAAMRFWQRCGPKSCMGLFRYPGWKKRVEALKAEIAVVEKTPAQNGLRAPPLLSAIRNTQ